MASTVTLLSLRDQCRQRADMQDSDFWTNTELNVAINTSLKRLYNKILAAGLDEYYVTSEEVASVNGQATYDLNAAFLKLLGLEVGSGASPSEWFSVHKFQFAERNTRRDSNIAVYDFRYRLHGSEFRIIPTPSAGYTFRVWYAPVLTALAADGDTFDGIHGFEEWAVLDVAIKMLTKEESDVTTLMASRADMDNEIKEHASERDSANPAQVLDVRRVQSDEFYNFWTRR